MIPKPFQMSRIEQHKNVEFSHQIGILTIYSVIAICAIVMSVLNIFTHKWHVLVATGLFSIFILIVFFVSLASYRKKQIFLFNVIVTIFFLASATMLIYFLISGEPEGFSALWILMVPLFTILFFEFKKATLFDALMLAVLCFMLWTPWGRSFLHYKYSDVFMMRFPFLYTAFFLAALSLSINLKTKSEILIKGKSSALKELYKLSYIDSITKGHTYLYFSERFKKTVSSLDKNKIHFFGVANIRHFSEFNTLFGEEMGHKTLRYYYKLLESSCFEVKLLCRDNADNFYFVMAKDSIEQLQVCFDNMSNRLDNFAKDMVEDLNNYPYHLMVYMGFVIINNRKDTIRQLVDKAKMAVYDGSRLEPLRNSLEVFLYGKSDVRRYYHHLFILQNIQNAFIKNEFILSTFESAIPNIYNCRLVWIHNGNRIQNYEDSLAVFGLRVEHDKYLVRKCCEFLRDECDLNPDIKMLLHLQPRSKPFLYQDNWFENTCAKYNVNPSSLMLS